MHSKRHRLEESGSVLAINLLFLIISGFAGVGKIIDGVPSWFEGKFGGTFLSRFPGLKATFWLLALSELFAFVLALLALVRLEFLPKRPAPFLSATLIGSLFVFLQLGFGQWLTREFNGAFQQFMYFSASLLMFHFLTSRRSDSNGSETAKEPTA